MTRLIDRLPESTAKLENHRARKLGVFNLKAYPGLRVGTVRRFVQDLLDQGLFENLHGKDFAYDLHLNNFLGEGGKLLLRDILSASARVTSRDYEKDAVWHFDHDGALEHYRAGSTTLIRYIRLGNTRWYAEPMLISSTPYNCADDDGRMMFHRRRLMLRVVGIYA